LSSLEEHIGEIPNQSVERRTSSMIELCHNDMSVCAQKARFALAEKSHRLSLSAS
jgi:hypothetical protein